MALTFTSAALVWRQADDDVRVATRSGEYAGFVHDSTFGVHAFGAHGEDLGIHPDGDAARDAVAGVIRGGDDTSRPVLDSSLRPHRARRHGSARWGLADRGMTRV